MKRIFLFLVLFFSLIAGGQMDKKLGKKGKLFASDSVIEKIEQLRDSVQQEISNRNKESIEVDNVRNVNYLLDLQKERKAKQKRNAIIRIAIGLGLLIILVIGWRRKSKK